MYRFRVKILLAIITIPFIAIILKLVYLQIFRPNYEHFGRRAEQLYIRKRTLSPLRGAIRDRKGKVLVQGYPAFNISVRYGRLAQPGNLADSLLARSYIDRRTVSLALRRHITDPEKFVDYLENSTKLTRSEILFELCRNLADRRRLAKALANPTSTINRQRRSSSRHKASWRELSRAIQKATTEGESNNPQNFIAQLSVLSGLSQRDVQTVICNHVEGETEWIRGLTEVLGVPTEEILLRADKIREKITRMKRDVIEKRKRKKRSTSKDFRIAEEEKLYPIIEDVDPLTIAKLEVLLDHCKDITIETEVKRCYPYHESGANVVGYVGDSKGLFCMCDIKDPAGLAEKLCDTQGTLSQYLRGRFSKETLQLLDDYYYSNSPSEAIQRALVYELNRLLQGACLYDKRRFAPVKLAEETSSLLKLNPHGGDLILLNRSLLGDAYPDEVSKKAAHKIVGEAGIEKQYNCELAGKKGWVTEVVNVKRQVQEVFVKVPSLQGSDLRLTIDIDLQKAAEDALGDYSGSVVLMDPYTGEIFALATSPRYDPNYYHEDFDELKNDSRHPLLNRPTQAELPPGSVFKIVVALAALEEGNITADASFDCRGMYNKRSCWTKRVGGHGWVALEEAIEQSCDIFFYHVGGLLGVEKLALWSRRFGLGERTGVDLPSSSERSGLVPSREWKRKTKKKPWFPGDTWNLAIGQGYLKTTPIQMARVMAAVANGGRLVRPRLLAKVVVPSTETEEPSYQKGYGQIAAPVNLNLSDEHLRLVSEAMRKVVVSGTAKDDLLKALNVAGKTGTSQTTGTLKTKDQGFNHAWFAGYMPFDHPRVCFVVVLESVFEAHGGTQAVAVARPVLEYFSENF